MRWDPFISILCVLNSQHGFNFPHFLCLLLLGIIFINLDPFEKIVIFLLLMKIIWLFYFALFCFTLYSQLSFPIVRPGLKFASSVQHIVKQTIQFYNYVPKMQLGKLTSIRCLVQGHPAGKIRF